jgi:c-di-GMP-binding flagellar brake protein YcgR
MAEGALKKLFSGLLRKDRSEAAAAPDQVADAQSSFEQVVIRLQQLVEERSFVDVRFPARASNTYQSLILKVDPLERYVLIDELFPAHGAFFVSPGDEVEVTSVRRGVPVRFTTWVKSISIDEADGIPAYRLALPDAVEAKQRRKSFRVSVDIDAGIRLRIRGPDANKLLCTVQDLSYGGVGFTCQGNLTERLRASNQLRNCLLTIPGLPDIACDLEVRTFEFRRTPYRHTVVGARFESLASAAEKQLEQYLVLLQRQQRREFLS